MARFTSRKFLLAAAAVVYVIVQTAGGALGVSDAVDAIWKIVAAYVAAEGAADTASSYGAARAEVAEKKVRESAEAVRA